MNYRRSQKACSLVFLVIAIASVNCGKTTPVIDQPSPTTLPMATTSVSPLIYPFDHQNMFFGLTILQRPGDYILASELDVSWVSMQPVVIWQIAEPSPGEYQWGPVDAQIRALQDLGLDCSVVLIPLYATLEEQAQIESITGESGNLNGFLRSPQSAAMGLYPQTPDEIASWQTFVHLLVERYDGDGQDDYLELKYPVRNWHFLEEHPQIWIPDGPTYVNLLKATYPIIKQADEEAKVILTGLASNFAQYFAFSEGYIEDPDAGVVNGTRFSRMQIQKNALVQAELVEFETILREGRGYYDVVDLHLYEPTETLAEGKIRWLRDLLTRNNVNVPIWCIEGGGPFKLRPGQSSNYGDTYYGDYTDNENAEFVVKMHVMAAAGEIERMHWGLRENAETDFWNGPWSNMALVRLDGVRKPSFYTFQLMAEKLNGFTDARNLSDADLKLYAFEVEGEMIFVAWVYGATSEQIMDLSAILPNESTIQMTQIITELDTQSAPVRHETSSYSINAVPLGVTPVFLEREK